MKRELLFCCMLLCVFGLTGCDKGSGEGENDGGITVDNFATSTLAEDIAAIEDASSAADSASSSSTTTDESTSSDTTSDSSSNTASDSSSSSPSLSRVRLSAFSDFSCSSNWTNRDGALGLKAGSGSGTCTADFPGESGDYEVKIKIQAEYDGDPSYSLSIDGDVVKSGNYPYSCGSLQCSAGRDECPDSKQYIEVGTVSIEKGASVEFYGEESYPCGHSHGAYAKWHSIIFTP